MESVDQLKSLAGASDGPEHPALDKTSHISMASRAIHADDSFKQTTDVTPTMHLSTTFRYEDDPEKLVMAKEAPVNLPMSTIRDDLYWCLITTSASSLAS